MQEPNPYKIPWSGKSVEYTPEEIEAVVQALKKADPLTQGKYLKEFETKFSEYLGVRHSFAVSSATAALELAAILCRLTKDDEVIIPAHTFCATAIPFARTGAKIVWADIDADTRLVTRQTLEKLITPKTKVIVVVHLYGLMAKMDEIMELAQFRGILVVEDVAQAIGAEYKGKKAGTWGDFGCFSFHGQKSINTMGEGGMVVVRDEERVKLVPGLRHNGVRPFPPGREKYWVPAMSDVDFDIDGFWPYNFCIGEVQCALGVEILKTIDQQNDRRRMRAKKFIAAFKEYPELSFQFVGEEKMHAWHLLSARYDGKRYRKTNHDVIELLAEKYGIKTVVQYHPLYRYPMFKKAGFGTANCPNTDEFFDNMVSFPFHLWMSETDFDYLIDSVKKALEELRNKPKIMKMIPRAVFGEGRFDDLVDVAQEIFGLGEKYIVYIIDSVHQKTGLRHRLALRAQDVLVEADVALHEPTVEQVDDIKNTLLARKNGELPGLVVGIGGGSVMDIAKAVSVMLTNPGSAAEYQGWDLPKNRAVLKMAVPTLSGTGSEATRTAVLTSAIKKQGINSDQSIFDAVLMDPELIKTVNPEQEFFTGMDCYIHCVESLTGSFINDFGRSFAESSKKDVEDFFLQEKNYGKMMMASFFGGASIAASEVGVCHALSYGLSLVLGYRHGIANCIVFNQLEEFYGKDVQTMREMMQKQNIVLPQNITRGMSDADMDRMIEMAFRMEKPLTNALGKNWRNILTREKVVELYKRM